MTNSWSRFNTLFRSDRFGMFCYNSLSNTLIEVDETHYELLEKYREGQQAQSGAIDGAFLNFLLNKKVIADPVEEENQLLAQQYRWHTNCFDTSKLILSICPTLNCNFSCPYCFESSQKNGKTMNPETQKRLITWIKEHKNLSKLSVCWYGGEPLLAFDVICNLTEKFQTLGLDFEEANMVTNGYLLDSEKVSKLNTLKITDIQITLDGPREIHDGRRVLVGGDPTFERIVANIATLMNSDYTGSCKIRVNVDKSNMEYFIALYDDLNKRFKGKKLSVYPGFVDVIGGQAYDQKCCFNNEEWADFNLDTYHQHGVFPAMSFHPVGDVDCLCVATMHNGFVVGPEGELYKCWDDVGKTSMTVGNIHFKESVSNTLLRAKYAISNNPYNDPECRTCATFPICGGGCPHRRLLAKQFGEKEIEYCTLYKTRLQDCLEAYIDCVRSQEMCEALLQPRVEKVDSIGYRVISKGSAGNISTLIN